MHVCHHELTERNVKNLKMAPGLSCQYVTSELCLGQLETSPYQERSHAEWHSKWFWTSSLCWKWWRHVWSFYLPHKSGLETIFKAALHAVCVYKPQFFSFTFCTSVLLLPSLVDCTQIWCHLNSRNPGFFPYCHLFLPGTSEHKQVLSKSV